MLVDPNVTIDQPDQLLEAVAWAKETSRNKDLSDLLSEARCTEFEPALVSPTGGEYVPGLEP